jgi:hypothetical protein
MQEMEPPMNADKRRLKKGLYCSIHLIGVHLRLSAVPQTEFDLLLASLASLAV